MIYFFVFCVLFSFVFGFETLKNINDSRIHVTLRVQDHDINKEPTNTDEKSSVGFGRQSRKLHSGKSHEPGTDRFVHHWCSCLLHVAVRSKSVGGSIASSVPLILRYVA